jgi:hypothetical protein
MSPRGEKTERKSVRKSDVDAKPQTERKHSDEWAGDLSPNRMAGQNAGVRSAERERGQRTAKDDKIVHGQLANDLTDDELHQVPILSEGQRLQQGGVYVDLNDDARKEFTATGDMIAAAGRRITSKAEVPYEIWNRLIGVQSFQRTGGKPPAGKPRPRSSSNGRIESE